MYGIITIYRHNISYRREALHMWKIKNGSGATYSKLIEIFERADHKNYADEVRRIVQLSNSKASHSSAEHSQPQVYPASEPQSLSQVPPAMHLPTDHEVYEVREGTPPQGKFTNHTNTEYLLEKSYPQ